MDDGVATEAILVAKKRTARPPDITTASDEANFDRVEFQAPPGWAEEVDAAAKALGMKRSAYIRMAVNMRMKEDRKS
jgi:hypothetical protein